jgi:hypothetical protein
MCKCGNQGCKVREARGLVPFCEMPRPESRPLPGFASYEEAAKQANGRRIRSCGGILKGSAPRFVLI